MSTNIDLITRDEQKALVISDTVGMMKLAKVMGPAYRKIQAHLKEKGIEPVSAPLTSYVVDNWEETVNMKGLKAFFSVFTKKWQIQMGFEVPDDTEGTDTIEVIHLPAGEYLQTTHFGPYQKVGETYKKIYYHAKEQNLIPGVRSFEYYVNDPTKVTKDKLETRILVPVSR